MATYIDNIVKFHTFSKSPVSKDTTLGGAVNPSGHTVTTSQVRAQDIPAFLNTFQGTKEQAITWLGTNYPTPAHNDIVFYGGEFKAGFSTPKCLKWNAKIETPAWEDFDITTATTLKNADDEDVIAVHQNLETVFVDGSNNAATNSNRNSLFVKRADGSILDHFVASTDKIVAGMPSLGYNALVLWNGGAIDEGELDANYIGNTFAGIVHLNKQYSTGDDAKFKVTCFEYIGEKLNTSITDLAKKVESVTATAGEGVQAVTDAATAAGLSVSTKEITVEGETDPVSVKALDIDVAEVSPQGVVTTGDEAKLVTAIGAQRIATKVASDEITAATLTTPEGSSDAIADTSDTSKLVTAQQVKTYVTNNAQVTVTVGETEQATTNLELAGSTGSDVTITATADTEDGYKVTFDATLSKATVTDGVIDTTTGNGDKAISATAAKAVAEKAIETAFADTASGSLGATIASKVADVTVNDISIVDNTSKVAALTTTNGVEITAAAESTSIKLATEASVAKSLATIEGKITGKNVGVTAGAETVGLSASDNTIGITTATYTVNEAEDTVGTWKDENYLVTGGTVKDAIVDAAAKALADAKAYADGLHSTNLVYVVLGDGESLPPASAETLGKIYLVKEGNTANGETNIDAISGDYVEYMTRYIDGNQDGRFVWEKIGTTAADLAGYAKTITINKEIKTVSANGVDLGNAATSVTAGGGITSGSVSDTGALSLILDEAGTDKKGIVQLASNHDAADTAKAATGATVAAAISALDATDIGDGAVKVSQTNGIVSSVSVTTETLVDNNAIKTSVADTNALITANDALAAIKLAKPENYVASINVYDVYGAPITSTQGAAIKIRDSRGEYLNSADRDLWGTTVSMVGNTITVHGGPIDGTAWAAKNGYNTKGYVAVNDTDYPQGYDTITKVENNMVYNGTTSVAKIKTNEIVNGYKMFYNTSLTSFSGDLSNLVNGNNMFYNTSLTSFRGDLSSLVNGSYMFSTDSLTSFSGDLSNLVNGNNMFRYASLASFNGDLSRLVNGSDMFYHSTSLASFRGDLSSLVNGSNMFESTSLESFNGDLSSLTNGGGMFNDTYLTSFNGDLSSLVTGGSMFSYTPLTSFNGDLSSLVNGNNMFSNTSLTSFSGDLSSLVTGEGMFESTSLDVESVELICDVLPNYNTENGGKQLQTATWNKSEGKYTYSDWTGGNYYYPIIYILSDGDSMSQGNVDDINRSFGTYNINESYVKTISIIWKTGSAILYPDHAEDRAKIAELLTNTAKEKGWTFLVNTEIAESGEIAPPNAVMATDGTIQYYIFAKKDEATEDDATHIDASGKLWKFDTAEAIIGPNIKYWSMFATVEDALTEWGLTPWTKPTEEETEA